MLARGGGANYADPLPVVLPLLLSRARARRSAQATERPNVVVLMTDDQTYQDMAAMPRTRRLIGKAGARFTRSYVSYPLCCPSRATYLTGQYNHNNGVHTNTPPNGGVEALDAEHTLPVWLRAAGYRTSHIGKYLNGYGLRRKPDVPPGWTDWHGTIDKSTYQMYGYRMYENGAVNRYGNFDVEDPALYQTDVLREKAVASIEGTAPDTPLFLSLMFVAPHGESVDPGSTDRAVHPRRAARRRALPPPAAPALGARRARRARQAALRAQAAPREQRDRSRASAPTSARAASR